MAFSAESKKVPGTRSPDAMAEHVRQKLLVAAVEAKVPTIGALLRKADEDGSGSLTYKEFYTTLRKLLQLTAAAVTDDAIRVSFKAIDKTGDGTLSRHEFASYLRGKRKKARPADEDAAAEDDIKLAACLDPSNRLAAEQNALRRAERLAMVRRRLKAAIKREGLTLAAFFEQADLDRDGSWSPGELEALVRGRLSMPPRSCSDADIALLFRELDTGHDERLSVEEMGRFLEARADAAPTPNPAPGAPPRRRRLDDLAVPSPRKHADPGGGGFVDALVRGEATIRAGKG